jgi:hypothetical protein
MGEICGVLTRVFAEMQGLKARNMIAWGGAPSETPGKSIFSNFQSSERATQPRDEWQTTGI